MKQLLTFLLILAAALPATADDILVEREGLSLRGQAVQGGLVIGRTDPGATVTVDGNAVMVDPDGVFLFGIGRDQIQPREISVTPADAATISATVTVAAREFNIERIDGLPPSQVSPPPEVLERIRSDARRVRAARARRDGRRDFESGFIWPTRGRVSGVYGSQRILNGEPRRPHYGIDVAAPEGAPVIAPAPGVVTLADPDQYYSGGTLIIDHGLGLSSTFLHMSTIDVEVGQAVAQGERLGGVGSTGRSTGPHLDWRMNAGPVRIDPQLIVSGDPGAAPAGH
ncbi:MAG: peptidoglycan DD-metalloendopeptidase family protein [Pseudomonadota bacterium]